MSSVFLAHFLRVLRQLWIISDDVPLLYTKVEITVFLQEPVLGSDLREQPEPPNSKTFTKHAVNIVNHTSCSFYDWSLYTVVETETARFLL